MSLANYSKIERDEISINIDRLEKIAKAFELKSYLDILTFDEKIFFNIHNNNDGYINNNYVQLELLLYKITKLEERINQLDKKIISICQNNNLNIYKLND
jgi:hypothetical protein